MAEVGRRGFLTFGATAIGGVIALGYLGAAVRYLYPPSEANAKLQDIGPVSNFTEGSYQLVEYTGTGTVDGVWVGNIGGKILAWDFHCTHLQCPVAWQAPLQKFVCPCHGSQFNAQGVHVAGPAPRGLFAHKVEIQNGRVLLGGILS